MYVSLPAFQGSESDLRVSPPRNKTRKSDDAPTEDGQKSSVAFGSEEDTSNEVCWC